MKRPLVAVVSFYLVGLLLAHFVQAPLPALFGAAFLVLVLAVVLKRFRPVLTAVLLVLAGWTNLTFRTSALSPHDLRHQIGEAPAIVSIRGTLRRTPQIRMAERDGQSVEHSRAEVMVEAIRRDDAWQPADGRVMVATPAPLAAEFFAGQRAEITGVIAPPSPPAAEGLFDEREYLATRGIFYKLKTRSADDWQLCQPARPRPPLGDRFLSWSQQTLSRGLVEDQPLRLLWAMTLGWRTAFTGDVADPFLRAGTMHMFAIDGLRIALLSGMLVTLLRVMRVSRAWCGAVAIPVIWFYTAATGWESSAIRASVMMTIVLGGWALKRPVELLNSLAAAAFAILLWEPRQLFEASFQLSFFVMLSIALVLPVLNDFFDRLIRQDPLLPEVLLPRWRRFLYWSGRGVGRYFSLSLAAWIGSIPLSALYFHLLSPVSPLANLVAVPLGTLALTANLGALICGSWFPPATELFNNAAWFFMVAMTDVSEWSTRIPGSYFYVPSWSWLSVLIYYGGLVLVFGGWMTTRRRRWLVVGAALSVAVVYVAHWQLGRGNTEMTILPLNGGRAIFVDADGRRDDWLIDCGNEEAVGYTLKNFLRGQGVNRVPRLALTGGELRNCGGALAVDDLFGVDELWTSPVHFRSRAYNDVLAAFERSARCRTVGCGDAAGRWRMVWPSTNDFSRADDGAMVLLGNFSATRVLLLSDLGRAGQSGLLSATNDLSADVVVAGLPGQGEPLSDGLLEAIHPRVIVVVDSEFPATRRAPSRLRERLGQRGVPVIYTRESGAVKLVLGGGGWELRAMDGRRISSREGGDFLTAD